MQFELTAENTRQALLVSLITMQAQQTAFYEVFFSMQAGSDDGMYRHYINELNRLQKEKAQKLFDAFYANYGTLDLSQLYEK